MPVPGQTVAARRRQRTWIAGGLALAVVVAGVLLIARQSSDDPTLTVIDGAPAAGFPLRGAGAKDEDMIREAADAWLADDAREDSDDRALDHDEDVTMRALWAGRLGDADAVILAEDRSAALVARERDRDDGFVVLGVQPIVDEEDPRVVAFDQAVLFDAEAKGGFMPAGVRPVEVTPRDGLWSEADGSSLPDGAFVLGDGLRTSPSRPDRTPPAAVVVHDRGVSTWLIDRVLEGKLTAGAKTFAPPAYQRFVAATMPGDAPQRRDRWAAPPKLRLVHDGGLPVLGATMTLTAGSTTGRDRVLAARGGSWVAGKDEATPLPLTGAVTGNAAYGESGPALAAAVVDRATPERPYRDLSVFVAGGPQVETIEILTGRRRLTRPGPVAVIPLPEATDRAGGAPRRRDDFAVLGRTRSGAVVVPSAVTAG